jgi:hypothetical protein
MRPQGTRVLRREQRHAWRGLTSRGRHARTVRTAYGQQQRIRDHVAEFSAWCASRREALQQTESAS